MAGAILLTGGTGMVGRNVRELAASRSLAIVAPSHEELDLLDPQATHRYLRDLHPDIVIHAAGRVGGIEANMRQPVAFLTENFDMGRNLIMAARDAGVPRLINLGSSCIYPKDFPRPLTEDDLLAGPFEPTNEAYAIAKMGVQRLAAFVSTEDGRFAYKTLIPCSVYGRYDNFDPQTSHLAAAAIHKLHEAKTRGAANVEIWGDGKARREFIYAGDLADAILRAVAHFDTLPAVMNVGAGSDLSVNDYYRTAAEVIGYRGGFTHDLGRPVGMAHKLMDVDRTTAWGWQPSTRLKDGLAATYRFFVDNVAGATPDGTG